MSVDDVQVVLTDDESEGVVDDVVKVLEEEVEEEASGHMHEAPCCCING